MEADTAILALEINRVTRTLSITHGIEVQNIGIAAPMFFRKCDNRNLKAALRELGLGKEKEEDEVWTALSSSDHSAIAAHVSGLCMFGHWTALERCGPDEYRDYAILVVEFDGDVLGASV